MSIIYEALKKVEDKDKKESSSVQKRNLGVIFIFLVSVALILYFTGLILFKIFSMFKTFSQTQIRIISNKISKDKISKDVKISIPQKAEISPETAEDEMIEESKEVISKPKEDVVKKASGEEEESISEQKKTSVSIFSKKPRLPSIKIEGILYNATSPIVIINGKIYKVGDTYKGAQIIQISKDSVKFTFQDEEFVITPD